MVKKSQERGKHFLQDYAYYDISATGLLFKDSLPDWTIQEKCIQLWNNDSLQIHLC